MSSMAMACLTGNLGKDAELNTTPNGNMVIKFSLAVKTGRNDNARTTWWNCSYWVKTDGILKFLTKGKLIGVTGEPSLREYSTDSGKRQSLDLNVRDVILLSKTESPAVATTTADSEPADDSIVPF